MGIFTFIKRPVFTTMLVMLLVVFGLSAYPSLGIDLYPDIDLPYVVVSITYTGASPEEMESLVTKPVEDAVSSVSGIKTLTSTAKEGSSVTVLEFEYGTDPKLMANDVREKVAGIRKKLPDDIDEPTVQRVDPSSQPIMYFSLSSDSRSRGEIRKIASDVVKDELQRLDSVGAVNVYGASEREIHIYVDPRQLEGYNISIQQVYNAINNQNADTPGGRVKEKGTEITVRTLGKFQSVDEIKNVAVVNQDNKLIKVSDVARVEDDWAEERTSAQTNGVPSVIVSVQKQSGTNTVDVSDRVKQRMKDLEAKDLPGDIKVETVRDSSKYIRSSVEDVMTSLVFGGILAVVITFLFLQDYRATLIGALAIPTSIIATFFLMKVMGFTLNTMSLMGLSLAVGILIDDAIVVIENIFRHLEQGKPPKEAARDGTGQIALAVLATTFSILAVFVPIGNMKEVIGQFFKQFGMTIAFAVAFSLFVAFTMTPMLSAYWMKKIDHSEAGKIKGRLRWIQSMLDAWEEAFLNVREIYKDVLGWALKRPWKVIMLAVAAFVLCLVPLALGAIGSEMTPTYDSGEFQINVAAPAGTSIDKMREYVAPLEKEVNNIPELDTAFMVIGSQNQGVYKATIGVKLKDTGDRARSWKDIVFHSKSVGDFFAGVHSKFTVRSMQDIMDELRIKFRNVEGLKVSVLSQQGMGGGGDARPVQIGLRGGDLGILKELSLELADKIRKVSGATDVDTSSEQSQPEVQVRFDPARMAAAGVNASSAGTVIKMAFLGLVTTNEYNVADSDYNIRVQLNQASRLNPSDVADLRIASQSGSFVRLGDIADVKFSSGPTQIDREGRQRQVIVYANTVGTTPGDLVKTIESTLIPQMNFPVGYGYKLVGQTRQQKDSFKEIFGALLLAIILIYMVLAAEFESFIHPVTIMISLPFSLIGAIVGLLVTGKTLSIISLIGIIMLMGIVTKNAILLVDYTNQLRLSGLSLEASLIEAGSVRLRPILMTTMAMIFGMAPIALGIGSGAELRQSMGVVLVGGLITSTMLTLIVVPLFYLLIERMLERFGKHKKADSANIAG
ncbi:MAG: acriflavin resistance protein [Firmicutes bacterium]|nr:acriflavin resistance protein [Bacillota bacterium]